MKRDLPFWYKMIFYWSRKQKPNRYGLTLPFIIGVQTIQEVNQLDEYKVNIDTLLSKIQKHQVPERVILRCCDDIHEYVLGLDDPYYPLAGYLKNEGFLLIDDDISNNYQSIDDIVFLLNNMYQIRIQEQRFSKNKNSEHWEPYNAEEIEIIRTAIS